MYRADEGRDRFPGDGMCRGIVKETKALLVLTKY